MHLFVFIRILLQTKISEGELHGILFPKHFNPAPLASAEGSVWIPIVLFTSFTLLVILHVFERRKFVLLFNGFINASSVNIIYREEYSITSRISLLLLLNYLLISALFSWQVALHFGILNHGVGGYALLLGILFLVYLVKIIATKILGAIFQIKETASEYVYNILLFNKAIGLILFPICLLIAYGRQFSPETLIWAGSILWALMLTYRLLRAFLLGIPNSSVFPFYIILYLCTLEIIPFILIVKVFVNIIK